MKTFADHVIELAEKTRIPHEFRVKSIRNEQGINGVYTFYSQASTIVPELARRLKLAIDYIKDRNEMVDSSIERNLIEELERMPE